jgi:DNA-binding transcriptional ArsR family regulator
MRIHDHLAALASPARIRLLRLLAAEELAVGELAAVVQAPQSTVSRHLKALLDAGWVAYRKDGTASRYALADDLGAAAARLWETVAEATDGEHAEDGLRLAAVLAARHTDSRAFFGRVAGRWAEVRRELFGDGFLGGALPALLPPDTVLVDLGCGPGDALAAVAPFVRAAIGVDREPAMLEAAAARLSAHPHVMLRTGELHDPPVAAGEASVALCSLVLHLVESPDLVLAAAGRAVGPAGHVVVLDMLGHDRIEYRRTMGHHHLGFDAGELRAIAGAAGLEVVRHAALPPDPAASGPPLFAATLRVPATS